MKKILLWYLVSILAMLTFVQTFTYAKGIEHLATRSSIDIAKIHCGEVTGRHACLQLNSDSKCISSARLSKAVAYISSGLFTEVQISSSLSTLKISNKTVAVGYNNSIAIIVAPHMFDAYRGCFRSRLLQDIFPLPVYATGKGNYILQRLVYKDPLCRTAKMETGKT
ncbi:MAG: hypothetical protein BGO31_14480 [Bacteroidetes bacterium 43-16]|nr:MAG: hypothetical protein BGO31_14480 [Bacteroidetes bacterium 43-16]